MTVSIILWAVILFLGYLVLKRLFGGSRPELPAPGSLPSVDAAREVLRSEVSRMNAEAGSLAPAPVERPAPTASISTASKGNRIDPRDPPRWVPLGVSMDWGKVAIKGGGYYVGTPRSLDERHPNLFEPGLSYDYKNPDWLGQTMPYWPQYRTISARSRAAYLGFLNSNRDMPMYIGYVFIYFYGIERRLLIDAIADADARREVPALVAELERLLQVYGENNSFHRYCTALISTAKTIFGGGDGAPRHAPMPSPVDFDPSTLMAVGQLVAARQPLPADWALAWARIQTPDAHSSTWDCVWAEAAALFAKRYAIAYPTGVVVTAPRSKLRVSYRWAAIAANESTFDLDVPDVSKLTAAVRPLSAVLLGALNELEPLRRVRRSKNRTPLAELIAVPAQLRGSAVPTELAPVGAIAHKALEGRTSAAVAIGQLAEGFGITTRKKLTKREGTLLASGLEALGVGIEPDVRFGSAPPDPSSTAILFRLSPDAARSPSTAYSAALLIVQAALLVAADDGMTEAEVGAATRAIEEQFELAPGERARLDAHIELLKRVPPAARSIESAVRGLPEADRGAFAQVLLDIAAADGQITPGEVRLLERFYRALQLDVSRVHADLHHAATGARRPAKSAAGVGHALDEAAIAAKLAETARVQAALAQIFVEEAAPVPTSPPVASARVVAAGLDADRTELLGLVVGHATLSIPRSDFDAWCESLGLMPEGALEELNEAAFEAAGDALVEGGDTIEVNEQVRDTMRGLLPARDAALA